LSGNTLGGLLWPTRSTARADEESPLRAVKDVDCCGRATEQIDNRIKEYYGADTEMEKVLKQSAKPATCANSRRRNGPSKRANATPIISLSD